MKRKGFSLITLLISILIIMSMGFVISQLFIPLARGIPKLQRLAYENDRISDMLRNIRKDIDAADALPENFDKTTAGEFLLIIRQGTKVICYRIADGKGIREVLELDTDKSGDDNTRVKTATSETWDLPNAKISFERWQDDKGKKTHAVAITTSVLQHEYEHTFEKFANSHVFFLVLCPTNKAGYLLVATRRLLRQKNSVYPLICQRFSSLQPPQRHGASTQPYWWDRVLAPAGCKSEVK